MALYHAGMCNTIIGAVCNTELCVTLPVVGHTTFNAKMGLAEFGVILEDRTPWILPTNV